MSHKERTPLYKRPDFAAARQVEKAVCARHLPSLSMLANSLRDQWGLLLLEASTLFANNKNCWIEDWGEEDGRLGCRESNSKTNKAPQVFLRLMNAASEHLKIRNPCYHITALALSLLFFHLYFLKCLHSAKVALNHHRTAGELTFAVVRE